ncbi:protease complex subunit PrcB family protein [Uliginosibacterium sp. H3]|uniref:Protease complex subunit PrcB family protein n=1 Tax=Uliginosibacterium silvisoli TaxID=3114758 RepID=A0ABU6K5D4_9RHOO|nr:protease complex subunit PrcB family protein [Uliginosibacterium sp. H3]
MMRNAGRLAVVLGLALLATVANANAFAPAPTWPILKTVSQVRCSWLTREPAARIFANESEWQGALAGQSNPFAAPPDWKRQRVIALTLGARPTPGYSIELDSDAFALKKDTLSLDFHERVPAPGEMLQQVMTQPCVFILVEQGNWREVVLRNTQSGAELRATPATPFVKTNHRTSRRF